MKAPISHRNRRWPTIGVLLGVAILIGATTARQSVKLPTLGVLSHGFTHVGHSIEFRVPAPTDENGLFLPQDPGRIAVPRQVQVLVKSSVVPSPLLEDSDAEVLIEVSTDAPVDTGRETVSVVSESFKIVPTGVETVELYRGSGRARFVITPKGHGDRKLRVTARFHDDSLPPQANQQYEDVLDVRVVRYVPTYLGVSTDAWHALQGVGTLVGVPSVLLLIATRFLDARKKKAEDKKADDTPKIILPK